MLNFLTVNKKKSQVRFYVIAIILLLTILVIHHFQVVQKKLGNSTATPASCKSDKEWVKKWVKFAPKIIWTNASTCACPPPPSSKGKKMMVIIVHSARSHFEQRQLIRRTWGSLQSYHGWSIQAVNFMVGQQYYWGQNEFPPSQSAVIKNGLNEEIKKFGDLTLGDFVDTYRNLTYKAIMGYKWLVDYCPVNVDVIMKTDDDVVFNIKEMIQLLNKNPSLYINSSDYYGDTHREGPTRNRKHKWFVPVIQWPQKWYPIYVSGFGQLFTMEVVQKILTELNHLSKKLFIDDIFLSGIVAQSYNQRIMKMGIKNGRQIKRLHINGVWQSGADPRWYTNFSLAGSNLKKNNRQNQPIFYIIDHGRWFSRDFLGIWKKLEWIHDKMEI